MSFVDQPMNNYPVVLSRTNYNGDRKIGPNPIQEYLRDCHVNTHVWVREFSKFEPSLDLIATENTHENEFFAHATRDSCPFILPEW